LIFFTQKCIYFIAEKCIYLPHQEMYLFTPPGNVFIYPARKCIYFLTLEMYLFSHLEMYLFSHLEMYLYSVSPGNIFIFYLRAIHNLMRDRRVRFVVRRTGVNCPVPRHLSTDRSAKRPQSRNMTFSDRVLHTHNYKLVTTKIA